ncbi:hypothetical protein [Polynucleobacter victoriensis]|uniref:Uncharacterized protein n=1 Tax=Polynucleobacter victoriensis TaxID=2049319 RepID=A0A212T6R7_9BURK|nr:hypothetical protein [Polynucleobacter victoriensis]SNC61753.1 hypothetical protein SAMN06295916_0539 [Polynucleobacter victoriensis]
MEQLLQCNNWDLSSAKNISCELEKFVQDGACVFKNQVIGSSNYSFDEDDGFGMSDSELLISNSFGKITWVDQSQVELGKVYSIVDGQVNLDMNFVFEVFDTWLDYCDKHWDEVTSSAYFPISSIPIDQGLLFYVIGHVYRGIDRADPTYSEDVDVDIALQIGRVLKFCLFYGEHEPHETKIMRMMKIIGKNPDSNNLSIEMMSELSLLNKDVTLKMNDKHYSKFIIDGLKSFSEYSGYPLDKLYTYNAFLLGENSPLAS